MDLGLRSDVVDGVPVLTVEGDADLATLPRLHERLRAFVGDHAGRLVVVDLDGLGHLEPIAIGALVGARLQARAAGGDVNVVCTARSVAAVFTGSGLDATFVLHRSVAEAAGAP